ncbi:MAG: hypothetical protein A4E20_17850 [Nitrospira sp. SG-bin2]|jgi:hypothetical protein|nr:MAG: hypothetical protein A4E20_17850 [Nitrospira sp. SG-bin2]
MGFAGAHSQTDRHWRWHHFVLAIVLPLSPFKTLRQKYRVDLLMQKTKLLSAQNIRLLVLIGLLLPGCAVYYRDRDTGAEHIFGFGHLSVRTIPPHEGKQALVQRMTLTGLAIGLDNGSLGMSAGWDRREHILIYGENVALTMRRPPSNDFFYFKIGTYPPELGVRTDTDNSDNKRENHQ